VDSISFGILQWTFTLLFELCVGLFFFDVLRHVASSITQSLILFDGLVVFIQLTLLRLLSSLVNVDINNHCHRVKTHLQLK
jgi:hypothetical protein